jgi:phage repressor protein C with HTH and peptisase S24 domain
MGGKDGALVFADQNMGDVLAPPILVNVPGAYAVYVIGESMEDRFKAGEVVYVHPFMPVRKDDDCVIQIANGEGEMLGYIKRFVSRDEETLRVRQLKPAKVLKFPVDKVVACHRIVFSGVG